MTLAESVRTNRPIIDRFFPANRPIPARLRLVTQSESTDNRPIFRRQSSDSTAETYWPIAAIVETATRDSALLDPAGKLQSVSEGQNKLKVIDADLIPNPAVKESLTVQTVARGGNLA